MRDSNIFPRQESNPSPSSRANTSSKRVANCCCSTDCWSIWSRRVTRCFCFLRWRPISTSSRTSWHSEVSYKRSIELVEYVVSVNIINSCNDGNQRRESFLLKSSSMSLALILIIPTMTVIKKNRKSTMKKFFLIEI